MEVTPRDSLACGEAHDTPHLSTIVMSFPLPAGVLRRAHRELVRGPCFGLLPMWGMTTGEGLCGGLVPS